VGRRRVEAWNKGGEGRCGGGVCGGDARGKEEVIVHSGRRRGGGALKGVQVDEGMGAIGARRQNGK